MTKTQQIEDLKRALAEERAAHKSALWLLDQVRADEAKRNIAAMEAEVEAGRAAAQAAEDETVRQIESGLIPLAALRDVVSSDYDFTQRGDLFTFNATFLFRGKNRIETALHDAIFGRAAAKLKVTFDGYTAQYADGGYVTRVVELSPVDRQLLKDIRDGAK